MNITEPSLRYLGPRQWLIAFLGLASGMSAAILLH